MAWEGRQVMTEYAQEVDGAPLCWRCGVDLSLDRIDFSGLSDDELARFGQILAEPRSLLGLTDD